MWPCSRWLSRLPGHRVAGDGGAAVGCDGRRRAPRISRGSLTSIGRSARGSGTSSRCSSPALTRRRSPGSRRRSPGFAISSTTSWSRPGRRPVRELAGRLRARAPVRSARAARGATSPVQAAPGVLGRAEGWAVAGGAAWVWDEAWAWGSAGAGEASVPGHRRQLRRHRQSPSSGPWASY